MNTHLCLPELTATFASQTVGFERPCLLVIGGRPPERAWLRRIAHHRTVWAVDRGLGFCRESGILPARIIGDGDSATKEAWTWGEALAIPMDRFPPEKDLTDTQLAIRIANDAGFAAAILTGAFGGRLDHAYSTAFTAAHAPISCVLADARETMLFLRDGEHATITCHAHPIAISLLPFSEQVKDVRTEHLHWTLQNAVLSQDEPAAVSNVLESGENTFSVSIGQGILAVYLCWAE